MKKSYSKPIINKIGDISDLTLRANGSFCDNNGVGATGNPNQTDANRCD